MHHKKRKEKAEERCKKLWDYYNENEGKLLIKDCHRLLETKNLFHVWVSFETHGLNAPEIWDKGEARYKRYSDKLNEAAAERGVSELTLDEMAIILGRHRGNVYNIRVKCEKYGYKIPDIKRLQGWKVRKGDQEDRIQDILDNMDIEELELQPEYLEGLQILSYRVDPKNKERIIYMLR